MWGTSTAWRPQQMTIRGTGQTNDPGKLASPPGDPAGTSRVPHPSVLQPAPSPSQGFAPSTAPSTAQGFPKRSTSVNEKTGSGSPGGLSELQTSPLPAYARFSAPTNSFASANGTHSNRAQFVNTAASFGLIRKPSGDRLPENTVASSGLIRKPSVDRLPEKSGATAAAAAAAAATAPSDRASPEGNLRNALDAMTDRVGALDDRLAKLEPMVSDVGQLKATLEKMNAQQVASASTLEEMNARQVASASTLEDLNARYAASAANAAARAEAEEGLRTIMSRTLYLVDQLSQNSLRLADHLGILERSILEVQRQPMSRFGATSTAVKIEDESDTKVNLFQQRSSVNRSSDRLQQRESNDDVAADRQRGRNIDLPGESQQPGASEQQHASVAQSEPIDLRRSSIERPRPEDQQRTSPSPQSASRRQQSSSIQPPNADAEPVDSVPDHSQDNAGKRKRRDSASKVTAPASTPPYKIPRRAEYSNIHDDAAAPPQKASVQRDPSPASTLRSSDLGQNATEELSSASGSLPDLVPSRSTPYTVIVEWLTDVSRKGHRVVSISQFGSQVAQWIAHGDVSRPPAIDGLSKFRALVSDLQRYVDVRLIHGDRGKGDLLCLGDVERPYWSHTRTDVIPTYSDQIASSRRLAAQLKRQQQKDLKRADQQSTPAGQSTAQEDATPAGKATAGETEKAGASSLAAEGTAGETEQAEKSSRAIGASARDSEKEEESTRKATAAGSTTASIPSSQSVQGEGSHDKPASNKSNRSGRAGDRASSPIRIDEEEEGAVKAAEKRSDSPRQSRQDDAIRTFQGEKEDNDLPQSSPADPSHGRSKSQRRSPSPEHSAGVAPDDAAVGKDPRRNPSPLRGSGFSTRMHTSSDIRASAARSNSEERRTRHEVHRSREYNVGAYARDHDRGSYARGYDNGGYARDTRTYGRYEHAPHESHRWYGR